MPSALNTQVPMNLFSTLEVDCSSPTCVPRLCSLTLGKLLISHKLEKEVSAVVISLKVQGSKNILRSDEILLPPSGQVKTDLALTFSLQYPHNFKRGGNTLEIMLQEKRLLKNQKIAGYRTLAVASVDMAEVMQRPLEGGQMLSLHGTIMEAFAPVAEVGISSLSSQPIYPEDSTQKAGTKTQSRVNLSVIEDEILSQQHGIQDSGPGQDREKDNIDSDNIVKVQCEEKIRSCRQQDANNKVGAWLRRVQVWREDLKSERESSEQVTEVEDIDMLYDSLGTSSDIVP